MTDKVTLRDIAEAAGVAESTVSRALKGNGQLAQRTRAKIVEAAEKLGYDGAPTPPSDFAPARRRRGVVGVVVAALHNSFYPYLVDRLHDELDDRGFDMVLIIDEITQDRAGRKLRSLIDTLDGVIVTTAVVGSPMIAYLKQLGVPTVQAIRSTMEGQTHSVESDNFAAGAEAMDHLVSLGHRQIGFLVGPSNTSTTVGRLQGARSVLTKAKITFNDQALVHTEFTHEGGYSGCVQLLRTEHAPTALFCANDVIAIGALDAAQKMGVAVPTDISIIGVDDIPMASWSMIGLTTVRQPIGEICTMAATLIADDIHKNGAMAPTHRIFPTSLIKRATTGPVTKAPLTQ